MHSLRRHITLQKNAALKPKKKEKDITELMLYRVNHLYYTYSLQGEKNPVFIEN
jgi:hypothetical protein